MLHDLCGEGNILVVHVGFDKLMDSSDFLWVGESAKVFWCAIAQGIYVVHSYFKLPVIYT